MASMLSPKLHDRIQTDNSFHPKTRQIRLNHHPKIGSERIRPHAQSHSPEKSDNVRNKEHTKFMLGSLVEINSESLGGWVCGQVVEPEHMGYVTVQVILEQGAFRKHVLAQSNHIMLLCDLEDDPEMYSHDKKASQALFLASCTTSMDASRLRHINQEREKQNLPQLPAYYNAQRFLDIIESEGFQTFGVGVHELLNKVPLEDGSFIERDHPLNEYAAFPIITDQILMLKRGLSNDDESWLTHFRHYSDLTKKGVLIIAGDAEFFTYWRESPACRQEVKDVEDDRLFVFMNEAITNIGKPSHQRHRNGHIVWKDGSVYEGSVVDGRMHGDGLMTRENGSRYKGTWKAGECTQTREVLYSDVSSDATSLGLEVVEKKSSSGSSTLVSRSSTVKAMDSPRQVSILLAFLDTDKTSSLEEYALTRRYELQITWGASASVKIIRETVDLANAVRDLSPSIVYIEDPRQGQKWNRIHKDKTFIEELSHCLCARKMWRGCVVNFGSTSEEFVEKACKYWRNPVSILTWSTCPDKAEIDCLWSHFMGSVGRVDGESYELAFAEACSEMADFLGEKVIIAPTELAEKLIENRNNVGCQHASKVQHVPKPPAEGPTRHRPTRKVMGKVSGGSGQETHLRVLESHPYIQQNKTRAEAHIQFEPPFPRQDLRGVNDSMLNDLERSCEELLPDEVRHGLKPCFGGLGSLYFSMGARAHAWLSNRVNCLDKPLYFEVPMSWGGPSTLRVSRVLPGRFCWFEAEVDDDVSVCDVFQASAFFECSVNNEVWPTSVNVLPEFPVQLPSAQSSGFQDEAANVFQSLGPGFTQVGEKYDELELLRNDARGAVQKAMPQKDGRLVNYCRLCCCDYEAEDCIHFACNHSYHRCASLSDIPKGQHRGSPCHKCCRVCAAALRGKKCLTGMACSSFNHDEAALALCRLENPTRIKTRLHPRLYRKLAEERRVAKIGADIQAETADCHEDVQQESDQKLQPPHALPSSPVLLPGWDISDRFSV